MKCTLIILFTFLALSAALKCQQCTGPGIFSLCNGIDDNGIEVDCDGANDMACYYSTFPIDGKTLNFHYKKAFNLIWKTGVLQYFRGCVEVSDENGCVNENGEVRITFSTKNKNLKCNFFQMLCFCSTDNCNINEDCIC